MRIGRSIGAVLAVALLLSAGCRTGQPVLKAEHNMATPGTIGGILQEAGGGSPIAGRRVHAVSLGVARATPR